MTTDMTKGKILPQLIYFTIPLILGNLFQLTYNAADSIIVGKYVGADALAAVGTAGPIMNLAILFISGMCMGAGILMSIQYGAKDDKTLEKQISTTLLGGLAFSLFLTIAMVTAAPLVLRLIRVPQEIISPASGYLRIIFIGFIFTFIYNFLSSTLRALGDSKTPLYFLMISSVFNIAGDLFFVVVLHWGVNGSAVATVLSQMVCCLSCMVYIKKKIPLLCLGKKWRVFDKTLLLKTVSYGITSALQLMCIQLGKLFIQVIVNVQGIAFMAAFAATNRIDDFALTPQQNIAHAATTFMAQNKGAGNLSRLKRGFSWAVVIEFVYTAGICVVSFFLAEPIVRLFVEEGSLEVIGLGVSYMKLIAFMYLMSATTNIIQGFFRGIGDLKITLISTITNMGVRIAAAMILIKLLGGGFSSLAWANFWGWIAMFLLEAPLMVKNLRRMKQAETAGRKS